MQGCKWAAITIIVVSAPVLGKVTQVSFERMLGTVAGGLLGYITFMLGHEMLEASDVVFTGGPLHCLLPVIAAGEHLCCNGSKK